MSQNDMQKHTDLDAIPGNESIHPLVLWLGLKGL